MNKDKRWMIQNDPGILRKKADAETDLFVFGYACKIFRDDQKALEMDQGKHLIPWMGDETLKIDRYDARGHLSEISQFEGTNRDYVLTSEEKRIECLCDEERYRALHHNEEEQEMYQEEELKRLKQALSSDKEYRQVAYQYETDGAPPPSSEPEVNAEDEEPFTPSPSLYIPANLKLPLTVKENQIIEKTAAHIASHGPQVEILIKTRQANNQKLNFLHVGSPLNPYYNFILTQIKTGRYKPAFMIQQEVESNQEEDHYLHPSLAPAPSAVESAPSIPSIAYKPSSDCSYNMLVNKIRNMQQSQAEVAEIEEPSTSGDRPSSRPKSRKRHSTPAQPTTSTNKQVAVPPQHVKEIISRLLNFAHSRDLHPSEIASNLLKQDSKNLGFVDPGHKYHDYYVQQLKETYKENIYSLSNPSIESGDNEEMNSFDVANNTYDPERPTEEDLEHSESGSANSALLQGPAVLSLVETDEPISTSEYDVPNQPPSKPAPVCFSIKKPKETERLEHMSVFPLEESSSDGKEETDVPQAVDVEKDKSLEGDKLVKTNLHAEEFMKTPGKSLKEKEQNLKNNKPSSGSVSPIDVIVISSQTSSDSGRKSISSGDSRRMGSVENSKKSSSTIVSRKSPVSNDNKRVLSSSGKRKSSTSSDRRKSLMSENTRKSTTPIESKRKRIKSTESSSRRSLTLRDSGRKSKDKKFHRKHKSSSSSPDKYRDREREGKSTDEKMIIKIRRESDDLPPLPDDPIISSPIPEENLEKKREERKKKVKQMIEKIKTESLGLTSGSQENNVALSQTGFPAASNGMSVNSTKTDEAKTELQKDFEEQLREQVKQSLKKIAETTLAAIPPITEDSCSQFDNSSAANSNGFETPSSCGRPMYRVSRTPSVGFVEGAVPEIGSSRSSSTVSRKSHKKKKHHKKKKKHKGRSKSKKHHESSSESSWEDDEAWASSSDSEARPKKRHKSSKRSHKRHKRKHRRQATSSSSSSTD